MTYFSNLSKTYAKDKLSKYATMILLVCCYLYRKRSNTINVHAEAKEQGRDILSTKYGQQSTEGVPVVVDYR